MDGFLAGGNMNAVERSGNTVLRNAGPWTPTVHRYLDYLAVAGIDWAPRPLGIENGRERLSFIEGDVPLYPLPDWVWPDAVLEQGARRIRPRRCCLAVAGEDPSRGHLPQRLFTPQSGLR